LCTSQGQDLSGVAALGGICYFNVSVETPEGDMALLEKVLEGANAPVDEAAEERKGGAGDIGKFLLSAGETQLVALGHVPKALAESKGLGVKVRRSDSKKGAQQATWSGF
jgi:hypothetical protein